MIPTPKLDDRTYADIIAEAVRLIPRYCPEWTNHNPSDPGITILELCAWMTEMILYRLNKVPDKNYLTFLDMLGIKLQPAQPARAHPGGQPIARPPSRCRWTWKTVWWASAPVLNTSR